MDRELLLELKEFLTERMVDNMSTKDLEQYVADDLFNYFDKLGAVSYTHLTLPTILRV